jgi:hypothetical protein
VALGAERDRFFVLIDEAGPRVPIESFGGFPDVVWSPAHPVLLIAGTRRGYHVDDDRRETRSHRLDSRGGRVSKRQPDDESLEAIRERGRRARQELKETIERVRARQLERDKLLRRNL